MSDNYTPHIKANVGDFAKTVLMPGDPLRSKFVAETFLENARLVNNVRGIQGYTGTYKGVPVSVMASGMGIPSIGIYSYELFNFFGFKNFFALGTFLVLGPLSLTGRRNVLYPIGRGMYAIPFSVNAHIA